MRLEPHLFIASYSVEDRSSAHTAAAGAVVDPLLTTATARLRWMDHGHIRRVLLVVAFATSTFVLGHFLKVWFTFATALIVFAVVQKHLHSDIGCARKVARTWIAGVVREVFYPHHYRRL